MASPHVQTVYFSPTGNTKKFCSRLAYSLGFPADPPIDLTQSRIRQQLQESKISWKDLTGDLIIFGVPVYVGRIPDQVLSLLKSSTIYGNNRWVIVIAVNGNVQTGSAVAELGLLLRHQGFRILAAANLTGKHSFCNPTLLLGDGRPDDTDFQELSLFANHIIEKLIVNPLDPKDPLEITLSEIEIDYNKDHPQYGARNSSKPPQKDPEKCVECRECFAHCPTDAIDFTTLEINEDFCIRCYSCVNVCAFGARHVNLQLSSAMQEKFEQAVGQRLPPEFFL
ncbi:MAG: EFR1 family ferrodoxin [Promethearchaeota archaeon]